MPDDVRARLAAEVDALRRVARDVAWVSAGNLHVTLKFLGHVAVSTLSTIEAALAGAVRAQAPFTLGLRGLGAFPDPSRPRVLWAGAGEGADSATRLAGAVEEALGGVGFPRESRTFTPHVTLGRVRAPRRNAALAAALASGEHRDFGRVAVERVSLMQSQLSPSGARYTELCGLTLAGPST